MKAFKIILVTFAVFSSFFCTAQTSFAFSEKDSIEVIERAKSVGIPAYDLAEYFAGQKQLLRETTASPQLQARYSNLISIATASCTNMDFETGTTTGWIQSNGFNPLFNAISCCSLTNQIDQAIVTGTLVDPFGGFPKVYPGGGNFSLRVGSTTTGGRADRIEQTFLVTPSNTLFALNYAAVLNNGGHNPPDQANIKFVFYDTLGNIANCTNPIIESLSAPALQMSSLTANGNSVFYKPWSTVYWDLSQHLGSNLRFSVTAYDCGPSGHFAYVYIDGNCSAFMQPSTFTKCENSARPLCLPNGYQTISWMTPNSSTDSSSCISPTTSGIYTCQVNMGSTCPTLPLTYSVTIFPKPQISVAISDTSGCNLLHAFSATASIANGSLTNTWYFGNTQTLTGTAASITYTAFGNYLSKFKSESSDGCKDSTQQLIRIFSAPIASFVGDTLCAGTAFTLTGQTSVPSGSISSTIWNTGAATYTSNPAIFTSTTPGVSTISLTAVSDQNCSVTATSSVLVYAQPQLSFTSASTFCSGATLSITNTSTIALGSMTYTWAVWPNTFLTTTNANLTLPAPGTLSVTLFATSEQGCVAQTSSTLTVRPLPTITVNSGSICATKNFTLVPTGATQYSFTSGSSIVSPLQTSTIAITGWNSFGCQAASVAISTISVYPLPTVTAASGLICFGKSFTLQPSGAQSYTYSSGSAIVSPTLSSTYSISGTSSAGCISASPAIVNITVQALPILSVNNATFCYGQTFSMQASGAAQYSYSTGSATVFPSQSSTYTITGADTLGCKSTITASVLVYPKPTVAILQSRTSMCEFQPVTFTLTGASTYSWYNGSTSTTLQVNAQLNQNYVAYGWNNFGCSDTAQANLNIQPNPTITVVASPSAVCRGEQCLLTASGALTYYWNPSNTTNVLQFQALQTTTYSIVGNNLFGCTVSQSIAVNVDECLGTTFQTQNPSTKIYPVPFTNELIIETASETCSLEIVNELGQSMTGLLHVAKQLKLITSEWSAGVYYCKLRTEKGWEVVKVLKGGD